MSGAAMSDTAVHLAYTSSQQDVILRNVASAVPTTVFLGGRLERRACTGGRPG